MQQEAIKKIADSMQNCEETNVPAEPIAEFLKGKCSKDEEFATLVMQEHKTLQKCFDFVYEQAAKHLNVSREKAVKQDNGAAVMGGWIKDNDVYMMAVDYFLLDDAEIERKKAEDEKEREAESIKREKERKEKENAIKESKEKQAKQKAADKKIPDGQLSLF